jgi:putative hemolysin
VARLACTPRDVCLAQALRFEVFNLELGEGLDQAYSTRLDADAFDEVCDHLLAEDANAGRVVGTYRLQTGLNAAAQRGYYCSGEFDLAPFEGLRSELIELGRACVAKDHRNLLVLQLLWRAISFYAHTHGARYLIGCSSLHSQDPRVGAALYAALFRTHLAPPPLQTQPLPAFACPLRQMAEETPPIPKLLGAYLALGAKICGPPAIDREFKTIDFLTLLDLQHLPKRSADKYLQWP